VLAPFAVDRSPSNTGDHERYSGIVGPVHLSERAVQDKACSNPRCENFGKRGINIGGHGWIFTARDLSPRLVALVRVSVTVEPTESDTAAPPTFSSPLAQRKAA